MNGPLIPPVGGLSSADFSELKESFDPAKRSDKGLKGHLYLVKSDDQHLALRTGIKNLDKSLSFIPSISQIFWKDELPRLSENILAKKAALEGYLAVLTHYQEKNWFSELCFNYLGLDFKNLAWIHREIVKVKAQINHLPIECECAVGRAKQEQKQLDSQAMQVIAKHCSLYEKIPGDGSKLGPESDVEIAEQCRIMMANGNQYDKIPTEDQKILERCSRKAKEIKKLEEMLPELEALYELYAVRHQVI